MSPYNHFGCSRCGGPFNGENCPSCSIVGAGNEFFYDPNPFPYNNTPEFYNQPPQPPYETYLCELCGNDSHYGFDCPPRVPLVYEPEPCYNQNFSDNYYPQNSPSLSQQYLCCANCGGPHYDYQCQPINETYYEPDPSYDSSGFDQPQPPQDFVDSQGILQALNKMQEELEEIKQDRRKKKEDMSIEEMRHEQQLVDYKIKDITNDLDYKRFRGEKINEEYERDCEFRIRKLKQDFNEWGSEIRKKEQAYNEERYSTACRRMLSITFDDEDDYIPLGDIIARYSTSKASTPDLPIEEPDNSLSMGDEHLDTTPSIENLVPILKSLINRDTLIVHSFKINPILKELVGELAHIALIPPGIVEADFDPNDDTSSDDDDFEDVDYVSFEEMNDVEQEEKEFDLEDILQIQDVILHKRLLKISCLIINIESLKDNLTPILVTDSDSSDTFLSHSDNSLPEFESFSDHTEETRSGSTTTHANYSLPEYDLFLFEIEPDHEGLISNDNSNDSLLEILEFESFYFDDPSFSRPPSEPPDVEICLHFEPDAPVIDNFNELNDDQRGSEIDFSQNVEDNDSFTFVIRTFLPFLTYLEVSPLSCSTRSEDTIFDPGIST
ncbi:hypothetical protein Tco_1195868 [Tanacetum coccineum]